LYNTQSLINEDDVKSKFTAITEEIRTSDLRNVDWGTNVFPLAVVTGNPSPGLQLTHEDLELLFAVLTEARATFVGSSLQVEPAPNSKSRGLSALADWADAAAFWLRSQEITKP
jgi:hypothetical protein